MAALPAYATGPVAWTGIVPGTADTSVTAPTHVTTLGTATSAGGSTGTKIVQVDAIAIGTTVAGLVNLFLYDGTTYHFHDAFTVAAYTSSTTVAPAKQSLTYDSLVLPSGWSLVVTTTVSGNVSLIEVNAFGAAL